VLCSPDNFSDKRYKDITTAINNNSQVSQQVRDILIAVDVQDLLKHPNPKQAVKMNIQKVGKGKERF
jgi:hypothetical protein